MLIALHLLSTMKVSSKLATSSSSNPAVGETVACHAIEPRSPHGRHGGRERRGLPAAHRLRAVLAKFFSATRQQNVSPPTVRTVCVEFHGGHDGHIAKAERPSAVMSEETLILSAVFRGF